MTVNKNTRDSRVRRWRALKVIWESKLKAATTPNDTAVAKAMIKEVEEAIKRIEATGEVKQESKYIKPIEKDKDKDKNEHTKVSPSTIGP